MTSLLSLCCFMLLYGYLVQLYYIFISKSSGKMYIFYFVGKGREESERVPHIITFSCQWLLKFYIYIYILYACFLDPLDNIGRKSTKDFKHKRKTNRNVTTIMVLGLEIGGIGKKIILYFSFGVFYHTQFFKDKYIQLMTFFL